MVRELMRAALSVLVLSVLCGLAYPLVITGLSRLCFPEKAGGSLITYDGRVTGSALLGQRFETRRYFHGRPSATNYDGSNSGGTNFGPSNGKFVEEVAARVAKTRGENRLGPKGPVPSDLVLSSGSGLDPDISLDAAMVQVARVARERRLPEGDLGRLVQTSAEGSSWGGPARVNVLKLNLALEGLGH
jgi:K+-transporting ATPase ATPase C chain